MVKNDVSLLEIRKALTTFRITPPRPHLYGTIVIELVKYSFGAGGFQLEAKNLKKLHQ
ncbi:hypothetical protein D3C87_337190 [compost metagenome]